MLLHLTRLILLTVYSIGHVPKLYTILISYQENIIFSSIRLKGRSFCLPFQQIKFLSALPINLGPEGGVSLSNLFCFWVKSYCPLCKCTKPILCLTTILFLTFHIYNLFFLHFKTISHDYWAIMLNCLCVLHMILGLSNTLIFSGIIAQLHALENIRSQCMILTM